MEGDGCWVSSPPREGSISNVPEPCRRNDGIALESASRLPCASVGGHVYAVVSPTVVESLEHS